MKKKYLKSIEKSIRESSLFKDSLEIFMALVEEGLLKERNWKHYCSSSRRPGPMYKEFEKCGLQRKCSIYLSCMRCYWWNSWTYCFRILKTSSEGVQTSKARQRCQNPSLEAMLKWGFNKAEKWYIHKPEKVLEFEGCKILCGICVYRLTRPLNIIYQI